MSGAEDEIEVTESSWSFAHSKPEFAGIPGSLGELSGLRIIYRKGEGEPGGRLGGHR